MSESVPLPEAPAELPQEYISDVSFDDLGLSPELRRAIAERGYAKPTPVQAKAFGPVMAGKDLIVRSKTGTGKTAAFGMPVLERIPKGSRGVQALVLCPTRELALQVAAELTELAKYRDTEVVAIYGGASMGTQEDALERGAAIVVGTPGRVYDHIRRKNLNLEKCMHAVLDEADEMLNQGFYEEVTRILDCMPKKRQVLLFSATVPDDIQKLIARYTTDAETLLLSGDVFTVEHIHHIRYDISDAYPKPRNLIYILEMEQPDNAIIFCNTRDDTELVTAVLNRNGFDADLLNGDLPQKERERVMAKIKRGEVAFMVATDIAARGIDISDLGHVINYSLPEDAAVYLHRVGRTGRIGKKGTAINLMSGRELSTFTTLEKKFGVIFEKRAMPTPDEATSMWTERHVREIKLAAQGSIYEGFLALANDLKKRPDADDLIAFMLRYFFTHRRKELIGTTEQQTTERMSGRFETKKDSGGGSGKFDKGPRRGERERPGRGDRERPARSDRSAATTDQLPAVAREEAPAGARALSAPEAAALGQGAESAAVAQPPRPPRPPRADAPPRAKKLTDRELFELLQSGKPLPAVEDPTAGDTVEREPVARAPRERGDGERGTRRERGPEGERGPRRDTPRAAAAGQARLWVNLGRAGGLDAKGIAQALESAGAPAGKVDHVEVLNAFSFVFVPEGEVAAFEALTGKLLGERALKVEKAKK